MLTPRRGFLDERTLRIVNGLEELKHAKNSRVLIANFGELPYFLQQNAVVAYAENVVKDHTNTLGLLPSSVTLRAVLNINSGDAGNLKATPPGCNSTRIIAANENSESDNNGKQFIDDAIL